MILCVIPEVLKGSYSAGNWKDVTALNLLLQGKGLRHEVVYFDPAHREEILNRCRPEVTDLIMHYTFWPEMLKDIRQIAPHMRLHLRAHNAEALQNWTREVTCRRMGYEKARAIYGSMRLLWKDARCRMCADTILGINIRDNEHYWRRLPGRACVRHLPYHSPWPRLRPQVTPVDWPRRECAILCMAGHRDMIGRSMISGFESLAGAFVRAGAAADWRFLLSPGVFGSGRHDVASAPVVLTERIEEPWDLLCRAKAVAVMTDLGHGTKTTVVDALAAGCHVIIHPGLAASLTKEVAAACVGCDPSDASRVKDLIARLDRPPIPQRLNEQLRDEALAVLLETLRRGPDDQ